MTISLGSKINCIGGCIKNGALLQCVRNRKLTVTNCCDFELKVKGDVPITYHPHIHPSDVC